MIDPLEHFDYGFTTRKTPKPKHFYIMKLVRFAPLQKRMIEYVLSSQPELFTSENDFIRKAVTLQAKSLLKPDEFEWVCSAAFKAEKEVQK